MRPDRPAVKLSLNRTCDCIYMQERLWWRLLTGSSWFEGISCIKCRMAGCVTSTVRLLHIV